ncbi:hypothetical protein RND81_01G025100 [Saponaria officinalis]|uniref:Non-specific lipid-transfer protein n=1 Tax=Saponaria officinalis TaxID=3572 RepID=A0AAW1NB26_SAPOF
MANSNIMKLTCAIFVCLVMAVPYADAAITCSTVSTALSPCVSYLTGQGTATNACCNGISSLDSTATTTPERQTACNCLKSLAAQIPTINYNNAASLPSHCGVNIPYKISPSTNCSQVV